MHDLARGIGLREDTQPVRRVVVEPATQRISPEVMVVGPVLLHQEDDVLDRAEVGASSPHRRRPAECPAGAGQRLAGAGHRRGTACQAHGRQELSP